jgi:hypothetical protein
MGNFSIYVDTGPGITTQITNEAGGVIGNTLAGPNPPPSVAIVGQAGMFHITNFGIISGTINDVDNLTDVVINSGTIIGGVFLHGNVTNSGRITGGVFLSGNSVYNGTGGKVGFVDVGGGNATVIGGPGADRFTFDSPLMGQFTKINNFTPTQHDRITLSRADFANIGPLGTLTAGHFNNGAATQAHPEIVYTQGNGFLYYDSNGSLPGGLHHFATLASHPVIANTDFMVLP